MIKDLKELEKLLKLCRKQGVTELKLQDCEFKLGDLPQGKAEQSNTDEVDPENPWSNFPAGTLSPEQLMYYSSGGDPADDPFRKDS